MTRTALDFIHRYEPPRAAGAPTLLMLHGTGGNEQDLLPLGRALHSEAGLLSPRGKVLERGMPRFFRRLEEGVFDIPDLIARTHELANFIHTAAEEYGFDRRRVYAAGFSNGANIAASLMLLHPDVLRGAILFRAMVPFEPDAAAPKTQARVFLSAGKFDPIVPPENTERLGRLLSKAGAAVTLKWWDAGHHLGEGEVEAARDWLAAAQGIVSA